MHIHIYIYTHLHIHMRQCSFLLTHLSVCQGISRYSRCTRPGWRFWRQGMSVCLPVCLSVFFVSCACVWMCLFGGVDGEGRLCINGVYVCICVCVYVYVIHLQCVTFIDSVCDASIVCMCLCVCVYVCWCLCVCDTSSVCVIHL